MNGFAKKKFIPASSAATLYFSSELADMPMIKSEFALSESGSSSLIEGHEGKSSSWEEGLSSGDAWVGAVAAKEEEEVVVEEDVEVEVEVVLALEDKKELEGEGEIEELRVCWESSYCL